MIQQAPGYMFVSSACDNYLNILMSLRLYLLVDQKSFNHYSERYSLLFLLLKANILHALVFIFKGQHKQFVDSLKTWTYQVT